MNDFGVCLGTGDIPTPDMDDYSTNQEQTSQNKEKEREREYLKKGYIKDSTNRWYNPKDYIDCLYADW